MRRFGARIAISLAAYALVVSADGQTISRTPGSADVTSPAAMSRRLEAAAQRMKKEDRTADRSAAVDICWPKDVEEYGAPGKNVVVLVSAVSREESELPLQRVYLTSTGAEIVLQPLTTVRRNVPRGSVVFTVLGGYREDSFYLASASAVLREGFVMADFAGNRTGFRLYQLPAEPPEYARGRTDAASAPDPTALRTLFAREFPGFPTPAAAR
jgi:hypothetical protein